MLTTTQNLTILKTTTTGHTSGENNKKPIQKITKEIVSNQSSITDKSSPKATKKKINKPKAETESSVNDNTLNTKASAANNTQKRHRHPVEATPITNTKIKNTSGPKITANPSQPTPKKHRVRKMHSDHENKQSGVALNGFILLLGAFLLVEGIWGLQSTLVFNVLTTNTNHAIIHCALGLVSLGVGITKKAFGFTVFVGLLLATVSILYFVPATSGIVVSLFNVNDYVAYLNIIIGSLGLIVAFSDKKTMYSKQN